MRIDDMLAFVPNNNGSITVQTESIHAAVKEWSSKLQSSLRDSRTKYDHSGIRGDVNELALRNFLRLHLPPKFRIGHGEVIDAVGRRSREADVVVCDDEQPFEVSENRQLMIIEGVAAAGEIKTDLTRKELTDCIKKGQQFKALEAIPGKTWRLAADVQHGEPNSDIFRFYERRPFFVFAYESRMKTEAIGELLGETSIDNLPPIDGIFILDRLYGINFWDGNGALSMRNAAGESYKGWVLWEDREVILTQFLIWLNTSMPRFAVRSSPLTPYLAPGAVWKEHSTDTANQ